MSHVVAARTRASTTQASSPRPPSSSKSEAKIGPFAPDAGEVRKATCTIALVGPRSVLQGQACCCAANLERRFCSPALPFYPAKPDFENIDSLFFLRRRLMESAFCHCSSRAAREATRPPHTPINSHTQTHYPASTAVRYDAKQANRFQSQKKKPKNARGLATLIVGEFVAVPSAGTSASACMWSPVAKEIPSLAKTNCPVAGSTRRWNQSVLHHLVCSRSNVVKRRESTRREPEHE